ncbi:MAG: DUF3014 domain-containing protein [Elusimicrobia bacterium]|nr:DUF3014 domain-containing protein [Elusimicrobiota bacterium]
MERKKAALTFAAAVVLLGAGALVMRRFYAPAVPAAPPAGGNQTTPQPGAAVPGGGAAQPLPPLDASDSYVRGQASSVFTQALPSAWLETEGLLRKLTAAAAIVAGGGSPRDSLGFLRPGAKFTVKKVAGQLVIDPKSCRRYDLVGAAAAALDAKAAARFIAEASPLFQQACAEFDYKSCGFKEAVIRAAKELLRTPLVNGDIRVREKVVTWKMADPRLESLSKAQKHLLRLGPRNQEKVQAKLRELALALGAGEADLPRPEPYTPAQ